ncbi:MAG: YraN family protein [bacterium]|nr:YraN family protein [bacterium]
MARHNTVGQLGEAVACRFLNEKHGFSVVTQNYRKKWGEIDIVARKDAKLHFVEVKTVSRDLSFEEGKDKRRHEFRPEDNIHFRKQQRLCRAIQTYLAEKRLNNEDWQFDAVVVLLDVENKKAKVYLEENIILDY